MLSEKILVYLLFITPFASAHAQFAARAQKNTLDYFIEQSLNNSPLLKEYRGQIASLSLDSQLIRASLKPQVNGISANSYAPVIRGFGYDNAISNGAQVSGLLSVSKSLSSAHSISARIQSLQIQSLSAGNTIRISEQDLRRIVTDQYIIAYGEQLQLGFNEQINELLRREDTLLKKLTQNNVYKQTDYLAFVVTLQQQLLNASQLEIQYSIDYAALNYLAGANDTSSVILIDPKLNIRSREELSATIFYRQFVLDSLKLVNDRSLIDINYRPSAGLFADAGYNSSLAYRPYKNFGTSAGINIIVPIYDGKQRKLQYSKISIQERARLDKKDFFMQQQRQQVMQLLQQLHSTDKLIEQVDRQIKYTETLIAVNEKLLPTGDIRLTDFILSLNNYLNAKNLVTQHYVSRLKILNQLNYWSE
ncbi:MAG: TolC family protein [Flavitalea sp.]